MAHQPQRRAVTRELAGFAARSRFADLPADVQAQTARAFLNWVGCALGGCREPAVALAAATVAELGGSAQATIVGGAQRTDVASAAFVNCISSSIMAFDDAHLATVIHPSGPAGAALLALAQTRAVRGEDFLHALALGIESQCRLANALVLPPARFNVGFYVTGLVAPVGVALAVGKLLALDAQKMNWAMGLGASQAGGFRATHGTMTAHFRPGHAARSGVWGALLAARGFDSDEHALEADHGFFDVYAAGVDLDVALDGLGHRFELLTNAYKPYPCGIVIHPILDACLDIRRQAGPQARVASVRLQVNPLALKLTGIRHPATTLESHVSLFHWAAAALARGSAGIAEMREDCIADPQVADLRARIEATPDASVGRDQAVAEVSFEDGRTLRSQVLVTRGSAARPMTDDELDAKFRSQARLVLPSDRVEQLLALCRNAAALDDVGKRVFALLQPA